MINGKNNHYETPLSKGWCNIPEYWFSWTSPFLLRPGPWYCRTYVMVYGLIYFSLSVTGKRMSLIKIETVQYIAISLFLRGLFSNLKKMVNHC
jgi:hypothetical protein